MIITSSFFSKIAICLHIHTVRSCFQEYQYCLHVQSSAVATSTHLYCSVLFSGEQCSSNVCMVIPAGLPNGSACSTSSQCQSKSCCPKGPYLWKEMKIQNDVGPLSLLSYYCHNNYHFLLGCQTNMWMKVFLILSMTFKNHF